MIMTLVMVLMTTMMRMTVAGWGSCALSPANHEAASHQLHVTNPILFTQNKIMNMMMVMMMMKMVMMMMMVMMRMVMMMRMMRMVMMMRMMMLPVTNPILFYTK